MQFCLNGGADANKATAGVTLSLFVSIAFGVEVQCRSQWLEAMMHALM
jgi:hypothetical protein